MGLSYLFSTFPIVNSKHGVNVSPAFVLFKRPNFFARLNLSSFNCSNCSFNINLGNISFPRYLSSVNILVIPPCDRLIPEFFSASSEEHTSEFQSPVHPLCLLSLQKK